MKAQVLLLASLAALGDAATPFYGSRILDATLCSKNYGLYDVCDTPHSFIRCRQHEAVVALDCYDTEETYCRIDNSGGGHCDGKVPPPIPGGKFTPIEAPELSLGNTAAAAIANDDVYDRRDLNVNLCNATGFYDRCDTDHTFIRCDGSKQVGPKGHCKMDDKHYCRIVAGRGKCTGKTPPYIPPGFDINFSMDETAGLSVDMNDTATGAAAVDGLDYRRGLSTNFCNAKGTSYDRCDTIYSFVHCRHNKQYGKRQNCDFSATSYCRIVGNHGQCDGKTPPFISTNFDI